LAINHGGFGLGLLPVARRGISALLDGMDALEEPPTAHVLLYSRREAELGNPSKSATNSLSIIVLVLT